LISSQPENEKAEMDKKEVKTRVKSLGACIE
jgi:hypothetical protein